MYCQCIWYIFMLCFIINQPFANRIALLVNAFNSMQSHSCQLLFNLLLHSPLLMQNGIIHLHCHTEVQICHLSHYPPRPCSRAIHISFHHYYWSFQQLHVFVQHIVTMHDFKVVHIGECCWETFNLYVCYFFAESDAFLQSCFSLLLGTAIHCTASSKQDLFNLRLLMKQSQNLMDNLLTVDCL